MTRCVWHLHTSKHRDSEHGDEFFASKQAALDAADAVAREFVGDCLSIKFGEWGDDGYDGTVRTFTTEERFTGPVNTVWSIHHEQSIVRRRVWSEGETWDVEEGE